MPSRGNREQYLENQPSTEIVHFEGGKKAPDHQMTRPSQTVYPAKIGFDEHRRDPFDGTVHGVPEAEGMGKEDQGNPCPSCEYTCKSAHGLARHIHAKHGGFRGLGKAISKSK